jgi:hypothetical protein
MNPEDCHKRTQKSTKPKVFRVSLCSLVAILPSVVWARRFLLAVALVLVLALGVSCRTAPPNAPVDFSAAGWRVLQGQAVWKPDTHRPELAGELLMATNNTGDFFVQFSKIPFPMAVAQSVNKNWRIEFGRGEYVRAGHGLPPGRFAWFELPRILAGAPAGAQWRFEREADNHWKLKNRRTGESLEGFLWP